VSPDPVIYFPARELTSGTLRTRAYQIIRRWWTVRGNDVTHLSVKSIVIATLREISRA